MPKISIKQALTVIGCVLGLIAGVWAFDNKYTPREVTDMLVADLQRNQMMIQRNINIQNAQQWLWYWQQQVTNLTGACAQRPNDQRLRQQLDYAITQRNTWQNEVNRLMRSP